MSRLPHFRSGSELHRDGDDSQSMSQTRARPAIRLDSSLSFISNASFVTGGGPGSPLLGDRLSTAAVASPTLLFTTRDVNTETARQRSLHSVKISQSHSHSRHDRRAASDSASMTSTSHVPFSQTSCGGLSQKHTQKPSRPHPLRLLSPPLPTASAREQRSPSSTSLSVGRSHGARHAGVGDDGVDTAVAALRHRCIAHASAAAAEAGEATHRLYLLESEPTLLSRPSEPRSVHDDDDSARGRPGRSATVSPAPRHALTLSDDFDGVFSSLAPSELGDGAYEEVHDDTAGNAAVHQVGTGKSALGSRSCALTDGGLADLVAVDEEEDELNEDVTCAKNDVPGNSLSCSRRRPRLSTTPPPRRAFVLSRRYSSADTASEAPQPCTKDVTEAEMSRPQEMSEGSGGVERHESPRGSTVLVVDGEGGDDEEGATAASAAAAFALQHSAAPTLPIGRLRPCVVMGELDRMAHTVASPVPAGAAAPTCKAAHHRSSSSSSSSNSSDEGESMMSPLPRPVHPSAFTEREHRDETANNTARAAAVGATEQLQEQHPHTQTEKSDDAVVPAATERPANLSTVTDEYTATVAATASTATQDLASFSTHSSTLPANTTTATAGTDVDLRVGAAAAAVPPAAPPTADAVVTCEPAFLSNGTPLNSMMMAAASVADQAASSRTTTATTATATSSLWLVSGSTPTPLRRLRERGNGEDGGSGQQELREAQPRASSLTTSAVESPSPAVSVEAVPRTSATLDVHAEAAMAHTHPLAAQRSAPATPSFSPEPAPPLPSHASTMPATTAAVARASSSSLSAALSSGALVEVSDLTPPPVRVERRMRPTESFHYSTTTNTNPHSHTADTAATAGFASPSSAESVRVSDEVKELVERAQAEVRRTRNSLLSTLREHRTSFHLAETSPTPHDTPPQHQQQQQQPSVVRMSMSPITPPTPSRSLLLLPAAKDASSPAQAEAVGLPQESATSAAVTPASRTSGEWRAAAATLRPQLRAAADAIERRLRGYDAREHGVLPMETVVRVAYYVVTRRQMPLTAWSLRTAEGTVAATPMRVSMLESNSPQAKVREGEAEALLASTPLTAVRRGLETPRMQRSSFHAGVSNTRHSSANSGTALLASEHRSRVGGVVRTRASSRGAEEAEHDDEPRGRPATCMSPSRTLEHAMAQQRRRAEEELYLRFYFTVLEAFRQVFGERYAWRHLGATNASRHDCRLREPLRKSRRTTEAPASAGCQAAGCEEADVEAPLADIENEFNEVTAPLETLFPRLRQQYALSQRERRDGDAGKADSDSSATTDAAAAAAAASFAHRPPPLDVLVYYRTFASSLREL